MVKQSYSNQILIYVNPKFVFNALTKEIDKWWTEFSNKINTIGDQLNVKFEDSTSWKMDVVEFTPNQSLEWYVTSAYHNLENLSKKDEWEKTTIKWKIEESNKGSRVSITHEGLNPNLECFTICSDGWNYFLKSLKNYLETGKGTPYKKY
jgi:hypothetical protein